LVIAKNKGAPYKRKTKYLDKSFPVFYARLKAGLQPAVQCRRVANPARAMHKLWKLSVLQLT